MATQPLKEGPRPATVSRRTDALVASVTQHHKAISAHQSQLLSAVAELDRRKAWRVDGATSMVSWLVQRCTVTATTAREWVTAAGRLETLPKIADALAQGKLSFDQVKPLVDVAKPESDAKLAEEATHWSAKQVRELATAAKNQSDDQAAGAYGRRFVRFNDRRRSFAGTLPDDQYAVVKGRLTAMASRNVGKGTPFDQRMADALFALCGASDKGRGTTQKGGAGTNAGRRNGRNGSSSDVVDDSVERATRPTVVVHADLSFLAGGNGAAELDVLGPLSREVANRLACDAKIVLSADDAAGHSIQQGGPDGVPRRRSGLRSGVATKGVVFPAALTRPLPTCTTSSPGHKADRQTSPTW